MTTGTTSPTHDLAERDLAESDSDTALSVHNLHVAFERKNRVTYVLEDVSFDLAPGECLAIVGESGSGKSVLGRAVVGVPDRLSTVRADGRILLAGDDQLTASVKDRRDRAGSRVAMIYQDPMSSLNPTVRVWKQVVESISNRGRLTRTKGRQKAIEMLRAVGVSDPERRIDAFPHEFSGGMMQRVGIAAAIAGSPDILVADEPTTALDVTVQRKVLDLLDQIRRESGMAMILITHDLGLLTGRADRTMVLYAGRVLEIGPTELITTAPAHPYTQRLLAAIPRVSGELRRELPALDGSLPALDAPRLGCPFAPRCPLAMDRCHSERPPAVRLSDNHVAHCWAVAAQSEGAS